MQDGDQILEGGRDGGTGCVFMIILLSAKQGQCMLGCAHCHTSCLSLADRTLRIILFEACVDNETGGAGRRSREEGGGAERR